MTASLKSLFVKDFRSIRGEASLSLDAPVILLYGPNGSGKTSLMSALELALTGSVASLERVDPEYARYLPHKYADSGKGLVRLKTEGFAIRNEIELEVSGQAMVSPGLLESAESLFFSERCYLAQPTLNRLLEIYQFQESKKSDSALTRFVKDLLRLDHLDALIDGLRPAGNVRRFKELAPHFWGARETIPQLESRIEANESELERVRKIQQGAEAKVRESLENLGLEEPKQSIDIELTLAQLNSAPDTVQLEALARQRREIESMLIQWQQVSSDVAPQERLAVEERDAGASRDIDTWIKEYGSRWQNLSDTISKALSLVSPPPRDDPRAAFELLERSLTSEVNRISSSLDEDRGYEQAIAEMQQSMDQGNARIALIDGQLSDTSERESFAKALSGLGPFIQGEVCPVCDRDYSEIGQAPLSAYLSEKIARLTEAAGRLQSLAKDRVETLAAVNRTKALHADALAKRLDPSIRDQMKLGLASYQEFLGALEQFRAAVVDGSRFLSEKATASRTLSALRSREQTASSLRVSLASIYKQLGLDGFADSTSFQEAVAAVRRFIEDEDQRLSLRLANRRLMNEQLAALRTARKEMVRIEAEDRGIRKQLEQLRKAKQTADLVIDFGKDLAKKARERRTAIVSHVFNENLNRIWRDLFVRLAPEEPFVPAFAVPEVSTGPVEAVLETRYRRGGKGGDPRTMLSAGNLNTAALTLFLALHLTVTPKIPWLLIDDPVQSMDEVHISQFAALLRTLSKRHKRQIVIAVHEKPLFDYLTLELSPSFAGDRLITAQLGRSSEGTSTLNWEVATFVEDKAIAV
jgi:DNA repair protein SbcC/Rad50